MKKTVLAAVLAISAMTAHASSLILQIGSFDDATVAQQWVGRLQADGITAYAEPSDTPGRTNLRAGPFATRAEAQAALQRVRAAGLGASAERSTAHTEPPKAERPFAYAMRDNDITLLYKTTCKATNADSRWKVGMLVRDNGLRGHGCWLKAPDKDTGREFVMFCGLAYQQPGEPIRLDHACITWRATEVYKGDPTPGGAF